MGRFIRNNESKKLYEESDGWDLEGFDELNEIKGWVVNYEVQL